MQQTTTNRNSLAKIHMPSHQIPIRMENIDHAIYILDSFINDSMSSNI